MDSFLLELHYVFCKLKIVWIFTQEGLIHLTPNYMHISMTSNL